VAITRKTPPTATAKTRRRNASEGGGVGNQDGRTGFRRGSAGEGHHEDDGTNDETARWHHPVHRRPGKPVRGVRHRGQRSAADLRGEAGRDLQDGNNDRCRPVRRPRRALCRCDGGVDEPAFPAAPGRTRCGVTSTPSSVPKPPWWATCGPPGPAAFFVSKRPRKGWSPRIWLRPSPATSCGPISACPRRSRLSTTEPGGVADRIHARRGDDVVIKRTHPRSFLHRFCSHCDSTPPTMGMQVHGHRLG
jgi:hypothetical protein